MRNIYLLEATGCPRCNIKRFVQEENSIAITSVQQEQQQQVQRSVSDACICVPHQWALIKPHCQHVQQYLSVKADLRAYTVSSGFQMNIRVNQPNVFFLVSQIRLSWITLGFTPLPPLCLKMESQSSPKQVDPCVPLSSGFFVLWSSGRPRDFLSICVGATQQWQYSCNFLSARWTAVLCSALTSTLRPCHFSGGTFSIWLCSPHTHLVSEQQHSEQTRCLSKAACFSSVKCIIATISVFTERECAWWGGDWEINKTRI